MVRRYPLATALLLLVTVPGTARAADFTVAVDAREAGRRILHVQQTFSSTPGVMALSYPKWLPGEHGPTGPNTDVAGLIIRAAGRTLDWRRDPVDMNTVRFEAPAGVTSIDVSFDFLLDGSPQGFTAAAGATENLLLLSWNEVSLYPAGRAADELRCEARLTLPAGWRYGTALETRTSAHGLTRFAPCSYTTLVDSPVLAGRHFLFALGTTPLNGNDVRFVQSVGASPTGFEPVLPP